MSDKAVNIIYKIRRKRDGLFSMGGSTPRFNTTGKIWKAKGHLTNHLNQVYHGYMEQIGTTYDKDCEIVLYSMVETPLGAMSIFQWKSDRVTTQIAKDKKQQQIKEKNEKQKRYEDYLQLQKEFGEIE